MKYNRYLLILPPPLSGSTLRATRQRNGCSPRRAMPHRSVNGDRSNCQMSHSNECVYSEIDDINTLHICDKQDLVY